MTMQFDMLVYGAGLFVLAVYVGVAIMLGGKPDKVDIEIRKLRFAAVLFTGIITLFIFAALLYVGTSPSAGQAGKEIFDKAITSMTPLAGAVLGYFFGLKDGRGKPPVDDPEDDAADGNGGESAGAGGSMPNGQPSKA